MRRKVRVYVKSRGAALIRGAATNSEFTVFYFTHRRHQTFARLQDGQTGFWLRPCPWVPGALLQCKATKMVSFVLINSFEIFNITNPCKCVIYQIHGEY